jgi:hypothetical protein
MEQFIISPELYKELGDELKKNLIQELRRTKAIASGDLLKSIQFDVKPTNDGGAIVTLNGNDYITYVDKGRKPGRYAPTSALKEWIKQKGIATDAAKVTAIAFAINNKIKRQGIKPRPVLERAYSNGLPMYDKIIDDNLNKDLDEYLNNALNNL